MEKIIFDSTTHVYKTKLNYIEFKDELLIKCNQIVSNQPNVKTDGFGYIMEAKNINFLGKIDINHKLDEIAQHCINECIKLYEAEGNVYNRVFTDGWVNVVRAKNPVQLNFYNEKQKYHVHTDINKTMGFFTPAYTYVYYIQMPDNLVNDDGVLYIQSETKEEYQILPNEDDLIIMSADLPHTPQVSPNSTKDRIVLAGNVGFEYIKKENSLI
jgi:hypothetical protein